MGAVSPGTAPASPGTTSAPPEEQSTPELNLPDYTSEYAYRASGTCGDGVWWGYDEENKTLVIGGSGAMKDYPLIIFPEPDTPWFAYTNSIKTIVIENGVTSIGDCAFFACAGLTDITIPNSVTNIGRSAFSGCSGLTGITIPDSVTIIGGGAFSDCTVLTDVYYTGTEQQWTSIDISDLSNGELLAATIHYNSHN